MKPLGEIFLGVTTTEAVVQKPGSREVASHAGSQAWESVRASHMLLIWAAWRNHRETATVWHCVSELESLKSSQWWKGNLSCNWESQNIGDARTGGWMWMQQLQSQHEPNRQVACTDSRTEDEMPQAFRTQKIICEFQTSDIDIEQWALFDFVCLWYNCNCALGKRGCVLLEKKYVTYFIIFFIIS